MFMSGCSYNLKTTDFCFWKTFHGNFISFAKFLPEICWEEVAEEIFCYISFSWRWLNWDLKRGLTSHKPAHYLVDLNLSENKSTSEKLFKTTGHRGNKKIDYRSETTSSFQILYTLICTYRLYVNRRSLVGGVLVY